MRLLTILFAIAIGCSAKSVEGPRRALVVLQGTDIQGKVLLEQASINSPVKIRGVVYGLEPGQHGIHIHQESELGARCERVGAQFNPTERSEGERPVGYLGNVKTFSGTPSRTDINILSSSLSLYEDNSRSVLRRSLVIHALPNDYARLHSARADDLLACGVIEQTEVDREEILRPLERGQVVDRLEKSILDGEKPWENVHHESYGAISESSKAKIPSNLNVDGVDRPDLTADSLTLKSAVSTNKIWRGGRVFEYDYKGFIATGMFGLSPKVSGGSIEGRLIVEPVDESTVNVQLSVTKAKMFNEDVVPELTEADAGTESRIVDKEHVEKPFQVKIVNGKVESVAIAKDEPLWTVNFKRALAAKLQLQLDGSSGVFGDSALAGYYADNTVYHAMEGCSTGECETWYHISEVSEEQLNAEPELLALPELCDKSPVFEIIKNRDFDKCRVLPLYNYNSLQGLKCNVVTGSGCENKISHVDLVRIIGCRNSEGQFIVQRVKATDKLVFKPFSYETEATEGKTIQHLTLKAIHPAGSLTLAKRIHADAHLYQTLTYAFDDDFKTHGPLMGKPSLREANSPMVMEVEKETLKREAERLLREIVADLESESFYFDPSSKFVPAKINMLRRAIASMDYTDLMTLVSKTMTEEQWSTPNQIVLDALVLSGTNPALMIVRDLILKGRIAREQAVQAVSLLVGTVETPTKDLLNSFIEMLKSEVVTGHRQLKITSALFVSRLVHQACINSTMSLNMFPKLVMGEFCNAGDNVVHQLISFLTEQLNRATDAGERIAMLTALGNIGHEMVLPSILPFITSCEPSTSAEYEWIERNRNAFDSSISQKELRQKWLQYKQQMLNKKEYSAKEESADWHLETPEEDKAACNIIRSKAIFALSNLALEKKEIVARILMPIAFNKAEETEARLAALSLLFASNPPQAFWSRVALSTWFEPNEQVAHFIYTTIASAVTNKSPLHRHIVVRAESVLPMMKPMLWTSHSALHYVKAGYQEKVRVGYLTETLAFPGFESFIPSNVYHSMYLNMGPWFTKLMEFSVNGKQVEKFADILMGKPNMRSMKKILSGLKTIRQEADITGAELNKIHEELKIEARATGQPELYLYVNLLDNYQRFFTLNPTTIMETVEKLILKKGFATKDGQAIINYHKYVPVLDSFIRIPSSMGLAYSVVGHHSIFVSLKSEVNGGFDAANLSAKLEGTLKPAIIAKMTTRVMSELPFTRVYPMTGINLQTAAALPGRFSIVGDLQSAKVGITWEFLGEKLHVLKHSIIPFTGLRKIDDFTPILLLKETKKVTLLEEPKEVRAVYGRTLGLNVQYIERGDVQAFKTPLTYTNDWFGAIAFYALPSTLRFRELAVILDVASSESKVVKSWISVAAKSAEAIKSDISKENLFAQRLFDTVFEKAVKLEQSQQQKEEWSAIKFQRVFNTMSSPAGLTVDLAVELADKSAEKSRRIGASFVYGVGDAGKSHRAAVIMEHRNERANNAENNFVLCADFESIFPEVAAVKRDLIRSDAESATTLKIGFGKSCTDDRKITITGKMSRAEEIPSTIRTKWEEERCQKQEMYGQRLSKECLSTSRLASILNKAEIIVDYNEMPAIVRNATVKASNAIRFFLAPHLSHNEVEVRNTENQIRIESVYYPIVGSMDLRVFKPKSNTFFHGINVHPVAEVLLPARLAVHREVLAAPNVCLVDRETITTFDGLNYNASISTCDQVITKDCSGRYKFAVLARHEAGKKIVTVLLNKERIEVNAEQMKVKINDMELTLKDIYVVKDAENKIVAQIRRTADNFVEVDAPSHLIRVTCDAKEVSIAGSPVHRGRLCGLCGSATGNKITDLTGPRKNPVPKELMSAAYELQRPAGCKSVKVPEIKEQLRRNQDKHVEEKKSTVFGISNAKPLLPRFQQTVISMYVPKTGSQCTLLRNKMVVSDDKRCFSTVAVPKCSEGCKPVSTVEQKLPFHCMPQKSFLAEKLSEEVSTRPLAELSGKEVSFIQTFSVPSACAPAL